MEYHLLKGWKPIMVSIQSCNYLTEIRFLLGYQAVQIPTLFYSLLFVQLVPRSTNLNLLHFEHHQYKYSCQEYQSNCSTASLTRSPVQQVYRVLKDFLQIEYKTIKLLANSPKYIFGISDNIFIAEHLRDCSLGFAFRSVTKTLKKGHTTVHI